MLEIAAGTHMKTIAVLATALLATVGGNVRAQRPVAATPAMSFFVTSVGVGKGANLGGIKGADAHCQKLAEAAGSSKTWHAYLSVTDMNGKGAINARDRIGRGPWFNAKGARIALDVDDLHSDSNNVTAGTTLTEKGEPLTSDPNVHDILTGSTRDGRAWSYNLLDDLNLEKGAMTCDNYTSDAEDGAVMVGHADRAGTAPISPWNAAHPSVGCSQSKLVSTGGAGLLYCFAID
jgi:hypothetical protein